MVPIDPTTDPKVVWGRFVEIVYQMYFADTENHTPMRPGNFPPEWNLLYDITIEPVSTFFDDVTFIGVIARNADDPSQIAIVFHGTEGDMEWIGDLELWKVPFTEVPGAGNTEAGFTEMYRTLFATPVDGSAEKQPLAQYNVFEDATTITIAGHSLGGALAIMHAAVIAHTNSSIPIEVFTYAAPMVGDFAFAKAFLRLVDNHTRVFNNPDIVPKLPGELLGYTQVHGGIEINSLLRDEVKHSIGCFHSLLVYLYTLNDPEFGLAACAAQPAIP